MGTPHKHRDVIISWANGEEIEFFSEESGWMYTDTPNWYGDMQYRIKPKLVKKVGWVNVYPAKYEGNEVQYHRTQYSADRNATPGRLACIRIEWEEDE